MTLSEWGIAASAIAAIFGVIFTCYKYIFKPGVSGWKRLSQFFKDQNEAIFLVNRELKFNGGGSLRDVVERIDRRLALSDIREKAIIRHSRMPLWETDDKGKWVFVSKALCELLGKPADELIGHGWINSVNPDLREMVMSEWFKAVDQQRDFVMDFDCFRLLETIRVHTEAYVMNNDDGSTHGYIGMTTSITTGSQ